MVSTEFYVDQKDGKFYIKVKMALIEDGEIKKHSEFISNPFSTLEEAKKHAHNVAVLLKQKGLPA